MRLLEKKKVDYHSYSYINTGAISGVDVVRVLNQNPNKVYKTLVTIGKSKKQYVFLIPVEEELDLKKAAKSVNEKSIEMLKSRELFDITGYIHGGCSPIGMKKSFVTVIDISAASFNTVIFSAGKIGYQVEVSLEGLKRIIRFSLADLVCK
jgi:Cys-tRNA(Pro)/Cys-tRNA(Cys) deacylase